MVKKKIAKLLLALGIGAATAFSGAALVACDNSDSGNTPTGGNEQTTPGGGEQTTPGGGEQTTPGGDNNDDDDDNGGNNNDQTSNPVIGVVRATAEAFEEMLHGDLIELKENTPITVDIEEGVTGEYCLYIAPPACMIYEGVGAVPYPNLVITATVGDEEYQITWTEDDGEYYFGSQLFIDFTDVTSITVTANQDVEVAMNLLDFNFNRYYVALHFAINGTLTGEGLGWDGVAEDTVIDEKWILDFVADLCVNCDLLGAYFDEDMTKAFPTGYVIKDDAEGVLVEDYDGETVRYLELWIDLHNFLQVEYFDGSHGNGRVYNVDDENETVDVDVDGIRAFIDGVNINALDGWTLSYTLLDYYYNDLNAGSAPWTLPVGYYIIRVDAAKSGQKTLSAYLYYHIEVEDENDNPPFGDNELYVSIQPNYSLPDEEEFINVPVDDVKVYFKGKDIAHDADWNISYTVYSLKDGQAIELEGNGWILGLGDYQLRITADSDTYGHFESQVYFSVNILSGPIYGPFLVEGLSSVYDVPDIDMIVHISIPQLDVVVYDADVEDYVDIKYDKNWVVEYTMYSLSNDEIILLEGNMWNIGIGEYRLFVTAQNKYSEEYYEYNAYFSVIYDNHGYNPPEHDDPFESMTVTGIKTKTQTIYLDDNQDYLNKLTVVVQFDDDNETTISLSSLTAYGGEVDTSQLDVEIPGEYTVTGTFKGIDFSFTVKVAERELVAVRSSDKAVDVEELNAGGIENVVYTCMIEFCYSDGSFGGTPLRVLPAEDLDINFDSVKPTMGVYTVSGRYKDFEFSFNIIVTDHSEQYEVLAIMPYGMDFYKGISTDEIYDMYCAVYYKNGDKEYISLRELGVSYEDVEALDLDTVGEKTLSVSYGDFHGTLTFTVVERTVVAVYSEYNSTVFIGTQAGEILYSVRCYVLYDTGYMDNKSLYALGITEDDLAKIDLNTAGEKTLNFMYGGLACTITFEVIELQLIYTFTGEDTTSVFALKGTPIIEIKVYNNKTGEVTLSGVAQPLKMNVFLSENRLNIEGFIDEGLVYVMLKCDIDSLTFTNIVLDEIDEQLSEKGSYTGQLCGKNVTITLNKDDTSYMGYIVCTTEDGKEYVLLYADSGIDTITILGLGYFVLDDSANTFTVYEN